MITKFFNAVIDLAHLFLPWGEIIFLVAYPKLDVYSFKFEVLISRRLCIQALIFRINTYNLWRSKILGTPWVLVSTSGHEKKLIGTQSDFSLLLFFK